MFSDSVFGICVFGNPVFGNPVFSGSDPSMWLLPRHDAPEASVSAHPLVFPLYGLIARRGGVF
jgi:hypothetical protein